jgi:hypothetical protein
LIWGFGEAQIHFTNQGSLSGRRPPDVITRTLNFKCNEMVQNVEWES